MAVLFVLVLLAVAKNGDGMRASSQTESMVEEATSWGKKCAQFGAKKKWWRTNTCQCPKELSFPRNCEGRSGRSFNLKKTIKFGYLECRCEKISCEKFGAKRDDEDWCDCPKDRPRAAKECGGDGSSSFLASKATKGCRCLSEVEATERLKMPVSASAPRFCDALVEQSYEKNSAALGVIVRKALKKTSPEVCQHALTGTINETEAKEAPWAENASELSRHGRDEDGDQDGDRGYGRMRAVKEDATDPAEKALWEHALAQVCKDECDDLLKMMKSQKETTRLAKDVFQDHVPFAQACAEHVVQHVEAEVLGCCGRSCGFDGRRCLLWPFFSPQEKVDWEVECCAEISILKNSSRELMCNSVLPDRLAKKASNFDLEEQSGTDIGKVLIGQNTSLFWTQTGAQESALGKEVQAHDGDKVSMDFLIKHQKIGEEYLRLGYFKEEPITKLLNESTSLVEVSSQDETCDFGKFQLKCPQQWMDTYTKACKESWMVADEKDPGFFMDQVTGKRGGNCSVDKSTNFAAPEKCDELANNSFGEILVVYFTYDHDNTEKPIACVTVGKEQCGTVDEKWWEDLELKPVHEVTNGPEIKNYKDHSIYYVKVKADTKQTNQ